VNASKTTLTTLHGDRAGARGQDFGSHQ
jgi:hypothetical protein